MLELDLKADRPEVPPKLAATVVLVRDGESGLEVFCVERSKQSRFLGGAIVFPGGKVDPGDADEAWAELVTPAPFERAHGVAACRETLEEAAILVTTGSIADAELVALRSALARDANAIRAFLASRAQKLDLGALRVLSRWVTPVAEARRFDTRFFLARAPEGQTGAADMHETMASFWASPRTVLRRFTDGEVQLAPPTHYTLVRLASCASADEAMALPGSDEPICPLLVVDGETQSLVLPGHPSHAVRESRTLGVDRYVLTGDRWLPG